MKTMILAAGVALMAGAVFGVENAAKPPANPGFEKLKSLVGQWQGKTPEGDDVTLTYRLVAGGSALEESMTHGDMVTVYHPDGARLMLTHYCAAQNQPRMRTTGLTAGGTKLAFEFYDATNLPDPKAMHMHNLTLTFVDATHLRQEWVVYIGGKASTTAVFDLVRLKN